MAGGLGGGEMPGPEGIEGEGVGEGGNGTVRRSLKAQFKGEPGLVLVMVMFSSPPVYPYTPTIPCIHIMIHIMIPSPMYD